MRYLVLFLFLSAVLASCQGDKLKKIEEEDLIDRIVNQKMPSQDNALIKDISGNVVSLDSLQKLEFTGNYAKDFYVDGSGEVKEIVVREKTIEDEVFESKLFQRLNPPPKLNSIETDCADKRNILQKAYESDQENRRSGRETNPEIDLQNLESIVSFIEKCGMPTLTQVNYIEMAGIWLVLQHAHPFYQKKYIPLIEEAAEKGDINYGVVATMKDRALMHEGKAQIYGTQVKDGKLYYLEEPEYVNQRRTAIDLEPIADYLARFSLAFDIPQKQK